MKMNFRRHTGYKTYDVYTNHINKNRINKKKKNTKFNKR